MDHLTVFSTLPISSSHVQGFTQPWGERSDWETREGRLRKPETSPDGFRALASTQVPDSDAAEVVALTQAYNVSSFNRPEGAHRGVAVRISGSAGSEIAVVADLLTWPEQIMVRVREISGGVPRTLGTARMGVGDRFWGDHLIRIRLRADGARVRARAWLDVQSEPARWAVDTTTSVTTPGAVGLVMDGPSVQEYVWMGASTTGRAPQGGTGEYPRDAASFSGLVPLLESMCYPLYGDGTQPHPDARMHISEDIDHARPGYRAARSRAIEIMARQGSPVPPPGDVPLGYGHCSRFSGTAIMNAIDPQFASDYTEKQNEYVADPANGWQQVGIGEEYDPAWCETGDVWITRDPGHVFIWIGSYGGHHDVIAEAAYGGLRAQSLSLVGCLRRFYLDGAGVDGAGRPYAAWRFVGKRRRRSFLQRFSGLQEVDLVLQTMSELAPVEV